MERTLIDLRDLYWAAGFIEGEGCFNGVKIRGGPSQPRITAPQVDREPLARLQSILGGAIHGPYKKSNTNHQSHYVWQAGGWRAIALMMTLYSLVSARRKKRIKEVIADWMSTRRRPRLPNGFGKSHHQTCYGPAETDLLEKFSVLRICAVDGCDAPSFGYGLCKKHYTRWSRHGDPMIKHKPGPLRKIQRIDLAQHAFGDGREETVDHAAIRKDIGIDD